jgi:hypothetical protein
VRIEGHGLSIGAGGEVVLSSGRVRVAEMLLRVSRLRKRFRVQLEDRGRPVAIAPFEEISAEVVQERSPKS